MVSFKKEFLEWIKLKGFDVLYSICTTTYLSIVLILNSSPGS